MKIMNPLIGVFKKLWSKSKKGTIFLIVAAVLVGFAGVFAAFYLTENHVDEDLEAQKQTYPYQVAIEYLMNSYEVKQAHAPDDLPELKGIAKHDYSDGMPRRIEYFFTFSVGSLLSSGEQYMVTVVYDREDGWTGTKISRRG